MPITISAGLLVLATVGSAIFGGILSLTTYFCVMGTQREMDKWKDGWTDGWTHAYHRAQEEILSNVQTHNGTAPPTVVGGGGGNDEAEVEREQNAVAA